MSMKRILEFFFGPLPQDEVQTAAPDGSEQKPVVTVDFEMKMALDMDVPCPHCQKRFSINVPVSSHGKTVH